MQPFTSSSLAGRFLCDIVNSGHVSAAVSSAWAPPRSSKVSIFRKNSHHQASSEGDPVSVSTIVNNSVGRSDHEPLIDDDDYEEEEEQEEEDDAECVPDLIEGDIAIPEVKLRESRQTHFI